MIATGKTVEDLIDSIWREAVIARPLGDGDPFSLELGFDLAAGLGFCHGVQSRVVEDV